MLQKIGVVLFLIQVLSGISGADARAEAPKGPLVLPPETQLIAPNLFVDLAKKVVPSVVNISTLSTVKSTMGQGSPDDLFRRFFDEFFGGQTAPFDQNPDARPPKRRGKPAQQPKAMALGTGFIIDESGLILTNNHVVAGADEIKISFTEDLHEKPTDGRVVGRDPELDVALIQIKTKLKLIPINLGDSDSLEVGEYVMAVGNPFGQGHSVTHGIISAKGRAAPDFPLVTYLQTDAPINPGNSGGPLVNLKGEVIGLNNAIEARAQGIGFAIPVNLVKKVLPQLKSKGFVERGFLGVLIGNLSPELAEKVGAPKELTAPFVTNVTPGSPAAKAGIKPYDVIIDFNGQKVLSGGELTALVTAVPVGQTVPIKVLRDGAEKKFSVKVAKRPTGEEFAGKENIPKEEDEPSHAATGMVLRDLTPELAKRMAIPKGTKGIIVAEVDPSGPAARSGIIPGDVILEVEREPVESVKGFYSLVKAKKTYLLRVRRSGPEGKDLVTVIILDLKDAPSKKE